MAKHEGKEITNKPALPEAYQKDIYSAMKQAIMRARIFDANKVSTASFIRRARKLGRI